MKNKILSLDSRISQNLAVVFMALVLLLLMPLIGALVFMARFVAAAVLVVGLVASVVAYWASPRFRDWLDDEKGLEYSGLHLARSVALHSGHAWARLGARKAVVGADELSLSALGTVEEADLPLVGDRVRQGEGLLRLIHGRRSLDLRSPVSGEIVETNEEIFERPELANRDPYGKGWLVSIRRDRAVEDRDNLLEGKAARSWFRSEVDRFLTLVMPLPVAGEALLDGGELVADLHRLVDDVTWKRLHDELFC